MRLGRAVLVGVDSYDNIGNLRFCSNDASTLAAEIVKLRAFSAVQGVVDLLCTTGPERPTRSAVVSALSSALTSVGAESGLLFYFSGHGIEIDGQPYLLPEDYDPDLAELTAIPLGQLMSAIRRAQVERRVIVLDSCYSGLHRGERAATSEGFEAFQSAMGRAFEAAAEGVAVLSSASINEKARERKYDGGGNGVFTHCLLETLRELHQRSLQGDGIRVEHLHELAYERTVLESNGKQHPRFFYSVGAPIFVFRARGRRSVPRRDVSTGLKAERRRLLRQLSANNPELQRVAAKKLIDYGDEVVDDLIDRLGHSRADVRNRAAFCLGEIGDTRALEALLGATRNRPLKQRKEPFAEEAVEALRKMGPEVIPATLDYMKRESLERHEIARLLGCIVPIWDGQGTSEGRTILALMFAIEPGLLESIPSTDFVIERTLEEFKQHVEATRQKATARRPEDHAWYRNSKGEFLITYLLAHSPTEITTEIRSHPLFQSGQSFRTTVLRACKKAGGKQALNLAEEIASMPDFQAAPSWSVSIEELLEDVRARYGE
jgi:hypothetical protein